MRFSKPSIRASSFSISSRVAGSGACAWAQKDAISHIPVVNALRFIERSVYRGLSSELSQTLHRSEDGLSAGAARLVCRMVLTRMQRSVSGGETVDPDYPQSVSEATPRADLKTVRTVPAQPHVKAK